MSHAGNGKLLRTTWVSSAGHGNQTALELLTGFVKLLERLDTGKWSSTDADDMTALSQDVAAETGAPVQRGVRNGRPSTGSGPPPAVSGCSAAPSARMRARFTARKSQVP